MIHTAAGGHRYAIRPRIKSDDLIAAVQVCQVKRMVSELHASDIERDGGGTRTRRHTAVKPDRTAREGPQEAFKDEAEHGGEGVGR